MQIEHIALLVVIIMIGVIIIKKKSIDKTIPKDPVKHCKIYRNFGCCHVDGTLCDVDTCDISITVFPNKTTTKNYHETRTKETVN
jgi:hypothetical protein